MKQKKELIKSFNAVIEDIMDNYDNYTASQQAEIKKFYESAVSLNNKLEGYDDKNKKRKSILDKFIDGIRNFFG